MDNIGSQNLLEQVCCLEVAVQGRLMGSSGCGANWAVSGRVRISVASAHAKLLATLNKPESSWTYARKIMWLRSEKTNWTQLKSGKKMLYLSLLACLVASPFPLQAASFVFKMLLFYLDLPHMQPKRSPLFCSSSKLNCNNIVQKVHIYIPCHICIWIYLLF